MELLYATDKVEKQCTSIKAANKLFGGDAVMSRNLLSRINALKQAETIKDIVVQPTFCFHKLKNKNGRNLEGYFAIDVKSRKDQWRIILQPIDENGETYNPCNIDQIADKVKIIEIAEVSKHYE